MQRSGEHLLSSTLSLQLSNKPMAEKKTKKKSNAGRPTVMTPIVVSKLEQAFSLDSTVAEACFYAGISRESYYDFVNKYPEYTDRFEALRNRLVLKARETVAREIGKNYQNSMDYLTRKRKNEFSTRQELTGAEGTPLTPSLTDEEKEKLLKLIKKTKK